MLLSSIACKMAIVISRVLFLAACTLGGLSAGDATASLDDLFTAKMRGGANWTGYFHPRTRVMTIIPDPEKPTSKIQTIVLPDDIEVFRINPQVAPRDPAEMQARAIALRLFAVKLEDVSKKERIASSAELLMEDALKLKALAEKMEQAAIVLSGGVLDNSATGAMPARPRSGPNYPLEIGNIVKNLEKKSQDIALIREQMSQAQLKLQKETTEEATIKSDLIKSIADWIVEKGDLSPVKVTIDSSDPSSLNKIQEIQRVNQFMNSLKTRNGSVSAEELRLYAQYKNIDWISAALVNADGAYANGYRRYPR